MAHAFSSCAFGAWFPEVFRFPWGDCAQWLRAFIRTARGILWGKLPQGIDQKFQVVFLGRWPPKYMRPDVLCRSIWS